MRSTLSLIAIFLAVLLTMGCEDNSAKPAAAPTSPAAVTDTKAMPPSDVPEPNDLKMPSDVAATPPAAGSDKTAGGDMARGVPSAAPEGLSAVPADGNTVKLTPENSTIQVIGTHSPPRQPDPRTIVFEKFTGSFTFDPVTKLPKSANAEIDANSLLAFDPRLTSHLKNREFIDVEAFPTIKFESTSITPSPEPGKVDIKGNLTLHGVTKEITIPATVTNGPNGVTVNGKVKLNRGDFKINHPNIDNAVQPEMELSVLVGKKTERP